MPPSLFAVVLLALVEPGLFDLTRPAGRLGLPADWQMRAVGGQRPPTFRIVEDAENGLRLKVYGSDRAAWIWRDLPAPVADSAVSLEWSWRVLQAPAGADLRKKQRDDAPLRVFVVFGTVEGMARGRARAIFYSWGGNESAGYAAPSHVSSQLMIVRLAGKADVGAQWRHAMIQPFEDYRRFWGGKVPSIRAVGLMQDTDQTGELADAELRGLRWAMPSTTIQVAP